MFASWLCILAPANATCAIMQRECGVRKGHRSVHGHWPRYMASRNDPRIAMASLPADAVARPSAWRSVHVSRTPTGAGRGKKAAQVVHNVKNTGEGADMSSALSSANICRRKDRQVRTSRSRSMITRSHRYPCSVVLLRPT